MSKESNLELEIRKGVIERLSGNQGVEVEGASSLLLLLGNEKFYLLSLCVDNPSLAKVVFDQLNKKFRELFDKHNDDMESEADKDVDYYFSSIVINVPDQVSAQYLADVETMLKRIKKIQKKVAKQSKLDETEQEKLYPSLNKILTSQRNKLTAGLQAINKQKET